jgi:ppGpp synthetase/RelA/SpoT-type nucleotidyltranferase
VSKVIVPATIAQRYSLGRPHFEFVASRVRETVLSYCEKNGFAFVGRIKDVESVAEKLETGRFSKWSDIDDFYGCTIVVPTLKEEGGVVEFLKDVFQVVEIKFRGVTKKNPQIFRFDASGFIGKLKPRDSLDEATPSYQIAFEVQVCTAFEHAWATTTRSIAYKSDAVDWRRIRLAAQMKAAVEQLDGVIISFDALAPSIASHDWPETNAKALLEKGMNELIKDGFVPREVEPLSWMRFCESLWVVVQGSIGRRQQDQEAAASAALEAISSSAKTLGKDRFPRSITLLQFCLGELAKADMIARPIHRYVPLITLELRALYPSVEKLGDSFNLDA